MCPAQPNIFLCVPRAAFVWSMAPSWLRHDQKTIELGPLCVEIQCPPRCVSLPAHCRVAWLQSVDCCFVCMPVTLHVCALGRLSESHLTAGKLNTARSTRKPVNPSAQQPVLRATLCTQLNSPRGRSHASIEPKLDIEAAAPVLKVGRGAQFFGLAVPFFVHLRFSATAIQSWCSASTPSPPRCSSTKHNALHQLCCIISCCQAQTYTF